MTARSPVVDVVILTWNDGPLLDAAVQSVVESRHTAIHLIVVDNGSSPPAAVDPPVSLVRNDTNRGVAPARNQGVAMGSSPLVCLLDSDARLEPSALAALAAAVEADDRIALAAPVFAAQSPEASAGLAPSLLRKALRALNLRDTYDSSGEFVDGIRDVDFAIGACQLFRRSAFDDVGGLDETYFYGPEDVDFCLRLRERGWRVVQVADARVHHPPRRRFKGLLTRRGAQHAWAVTRHLWRHRNFRRRINR
jgi:GT2 family glycosyltransferase